MLLLSFCLFPQDRLSLFQHKLALLLFSPTIKEHYNCHLKMENECISKTSIISNSPRLVRCSFKQQTPVIKNIEKLLLDEAKLELFQPTRPFNEALVNHYKQASIQLKLQLRKAEKSRWDSALQSEQITLIEEKIKFTLQKMRKLKELNIYFYELTKEEGNLQADVQKFMFYTPKNDDMERKLQEFLTEQTTSELLLKQYEKSFNSNNFVAEIIEFFDFLNRNKLIEIQKEKQCGWVRNSDLLLIENTNIIFRQICEISDKYTLVQEQLKQAYIHLNFIKANTEVQCLAPKKYKQETEIVQNKMKQLSTIAQKIKRHVGNVECLLATEETIVLAEQPDLFETMAAEFDFSLKERNQNFFAFLEELYEGKQYQETYKEGNFNFIRLKIIKAEMRWHLNRFFSALNVGSHIAAKLHDNITPKPKHYSFNPPSLLIKYELNQKRMGFYSERDADACELELLTKNIDVVRKQEGFMLHMQRSKVVYPSALHGYYYLLKYLLCLSTVLQQKKLYSQQLLLQIISIKTDQMMQWAQTVLNIFEMIKGKYFSCYSILQDYLKMLFNIKWLEELNYIKRQIKEGEGVSTLLAFYSEKTNKSQWVNQIIFQFDNSLDIYEPLKKIVDIQKRQSRTGHCSDYQRFYQLILNEVIETRNNLKFQRCYSFNALHQLFGFPNARPSDLKDLAIQLAPISKNRMRISDLLRFYGNQNKIKRQVFKAELYWISIIQPSVKHKFIFTNQKKKINFKDFLEQNAKYLLSLSDKSLQFFLNNLEEVERAVLLFSYEVERLKLIQSSLLLLKPNFPLEDCIAAFTQKQLCGFFNYCSTFNLVEEIYIVRQKKRAILSNIQKLLNSSKLKFADLNMQNSIVLLKNLLAGFIYIIYAFGQHYTHEDCLSLKDKVINQDKCPQEHLKLQVWRSKMDIIKQYQENQFLDWQTLAELVQIYELLLHITLIRIMKREDISPADIHKFNQIRKQLPSYEPFNLLFQLKTLEKTKRFANTFSKSHSLSCLKCIMEEFKEKQQNFKGYGSNWEAIESVFILSQIDIVSRRLFCNEMIQLKNQVSGQQWKYFNKQNCLTKLKTIFQSYFIDQINNFLLEELSSNELLNINHSFTQNYSSLIELCRKQIIQQYDDKFSIEGQEKRIIVLFDEERGVEVDFNQEENNDSNFKSPTKKHRTHFKRGLLNTVKMEDANTAALTSALQQKVNFEIVKQSLPIRKMIYHLQLEQKRIRDEIAWQTCKLQHTVINKINHFIEESNLDQKQSLINFKYTVNLETIKGIQNVIHERTEIFNKNSDESQGFITQPKNRQQKKEEEESLLDINVKNVFNHVKKIKVFWAWKNQYLSKQCGQDQWNKFSVNAQRILYNKENILKIKHLEELRQNCSKQEILCNLIKEQNNLLNNSIKNAKISNLNQKLKEFKEKHQVGENRQSLYGNLYNNRLEE